MKRPPVHREEIGVRSSQHQPDMFWPDLPPDSRLGIVGGTFDPIHYGHLAIAEAARERFALSAVLFIPAGAPPHKPVGRAPAEARYMMTWLAVAEHPAFGVSRLELERPGPSYTVETVRAIHAHYPTFRLYLILGADMALDFASWRDPDEIMALATVVAVTRPGVTLEALHARQTAKGLAPIEALTVPGLAISSTELRARIRAGQSIRYLTPDPVAGFIVKMGLYRRTEG
jgi:nicotinate-nucleotide adenylyltransferase